MRLNRLLAAMGVAACMACPATAATVFYDDFSAEAVLAPASDFDSFNNWSFKSGSADLLTDGDFGLSCPS
ncbi:MAG: hypothetical protein AAFX62_18930, partial [Pseudomonadota bacterium]